MSNRFLFNVFIIFSVILGPWWLSLGLIFLGCVIFENFYNGIIFAGIIDIVYGHFEVWQDILRSYTFLVFWFFILMVFLRPRLRFYSKG